MRNKQSGILTYEWHDFDFKGINSIRHMTKEEFENHYGEFEAMIFPRGNDKPYAIWTKEYVVLFLDEDPLGIASITRNPTQFMFG